MGIDKDLEDDGIKLCDIQGKYYRNIDSDTPRVMKAKEICFHIGCGGINKACSYFRELNGER